MAVVAVGCGGNRTGEEVERRAALEVEVAPGDSLPAAVLGAAPAPRGVAVQYFPADPAHAGTWPCRRGRGRSRR